MSWKPGDSCVVKVAKSVRRFYRHLHNKQCVIDHINPNTGDVHVHTPDGGHAIVSPNCLYTVKECKR
jgi:hypothetical protein